MVDGIEANTLMGLSMRCINNKEDNINYLWDLGIIGNYGTFSLTLKINNMIIACFDLVNYSDGK